MSKFFRIDNPLFVFLGRITDLLILNLLWLICCIPIITIVPATSALYYVALKMVREEDSGIIKSFFHAFKDNLKQGIPMTLIFLAFGVILYLNYMYSGVLNEAAGNIFRILSLVAGAVLLTFFSYTTALQAQFSNTIMQTFKNAYYISIRKLHRTLIILALNLVPLFTMILLPELYNILLPLWIFLAPAGIAYLCARQFVKIFDPLISKASEESANT